MPNYNAFRHYADAASCSTFLKTRSEAESELQYAPITIHDIVVAAQKKHALSDNQLAQIEKIAGDNI